MFRAGLLLIIRRYYVDWPLAGSCQQPVNINAWLYQLMYIQRSTSWWWAVSLLEHIEV